MKSGKEEIGKSGNGRKAEEKGRKAEIGKSENGESGKLKIGKPEIGGTGNQDFAGGFGVSGVIMRIT